MIGLAGGSNHAPPRQAYQFFNSSKMMVFGYIKLENPTLSELTTWYAKSGLPIRNFFNTSGLLYKSLDLKNKLPGMTEKEMLQLLSTDGMLVKRPLLIGDDFVLVGFREAQWTAYKE